jgi:chromosome segregation ATPase
MAWLKRAWVWLKKNWKWVAGGVTILVMAALGVSYKRNLRKSELNRHKIKVLKTEREVARLEGQRDIIRKQESDVEGNISVIDDRIAAKTDEIKNSRNEIDRLTAEEKLKRFKDLGY